jgi:Na+/proline symporter/signal transduction histidine kinase
MLQGWVVVAVALGYLGLLFLVASYGDRVKPQRRPGPAAKLVYPLSLAVYCTSWTFFGSVGLASRTGIDFLAIYIGPVVMIAVCYPLVLRVVRLAKAHNITSIADFIAARYGKHQGVAATVAAIAIIGTVPYIALQLKAVSGSLGTILAQLETTTGVYQPPVGDLALFVALAMAAFAMLFGTRQIDATEHHDGLMLAIASESIVKLVAFMAVGVFVTFVMFGGPQELLAQAALRPSLLARLTQAPHPATFATMTLLAFFAFMLLPRQFHVAVVENKGEAEIRRAAWLFPLYLVLINLFVVPVAIGGLLRFHEGTVDTDMVVLALPLAVGSRSAELLALAAFVGGLSAATAMVIVECVALAIMVSNDIVFPLMLKRREGWVAGGENAGAVLLAVRRLAILLVLALAYFYYRHAGAAGLASIGLLSFAAIAQLAPAFFGGLIWRRATARGAIAGMVVGLLAWAYTLFLPSLVGTAGFDRLADGAFGLRPFEAPHLGDLSLSPLVAGVVSSLILNIAAYLVFSLQRRPSPIEELQANLFVAAALAPKTPSFRWRRSAIRVEELAAVVGRYIGQQRTQSAFEGFLLRRGRRFDPREEADFHLLRDAEHLLASAIGAASSRLVLSLLLRKRMVSTTAALRLLDDANAAIQYNREILQTALDQVRQGIAVYDKNLHLICWNRRFGEILALPSDLIRMGVGLDDILRFMAERGAFGPGRVEDLLAQRLERYVAAADPLLERFADSGLVIEIRSHRMPDAGLVTTLTDITASVAAADALERAKESLERRVQERTEELTALNAALAHAKSQAEQANISKTHFLAAAGHDILQPLNAARLYVTSLIERQGESEDRALVANLDASLEAVEEILGALLDISRLDAGAMKPELSVFRIDDLLRQLEVEFAPLARKKGLRLRFVGCSRSVRSDRRLLRRLLENLISNAIKYTPKGRVLVGCRRRGATVRIDVLDTGLGIAPAKTKVIFREFHRLARGAKVARGLGLGLSIVERIARVLDHQISVTSRSGKGSRFSVELAAVPTPSRALSPKAPQPLAALKLDDMAVLCVDNDQSILDGMATLLAGWGCQTFTAPDLESARGILGAAKTRLDGLLIDYHLDQGNGLDVIVALRAQLGELPAILMTADRSPRVRAAARARQVHILHKPLKPAALRALLTQWRVRRIAAE